MNHGEVLGELDKGDERRSLERMLSRRMSRDVAIRSTHRRPSPYATLAPADILTVLTEDNEQLTLFVKHISTEPSPHPEKQVRQREMLVYENLLADDGLPVAAYAGSRLDPASGSIELYLEYVDDWNLLYQDLDCWNVAARRLAQLHGYFAAREKRLLGCPYLLRLDEAYFWSWAERARDTVAEGYRALLPGMSAVLDDYQAAIDPVVSRTPTLVHNDLAPKNVIADRSRSLARICIVDWEMAGIGCGVLDLVHLTFGLHPEAEHAMFLAYREELDSTGILPVDIAEWNALIAACQLHKLVYRLAFSATWSLPEKTVAGWISLALDLLRSSRVAGTLTNLAGTPSLSDTP